MSDRRSDTAAAATTMLVLLSLALAIGVTLNAISIRPAHPQTLLERLFGAQPPPPKKIHRSRRAVYPRSAGRGVRPAARVKTSPVRAAVPVPDATPIVPTEVRTISVPGFGGRIHGESQ